MSGPITWQNVAAPSFKDSLLASAQAQQGMEGVFTGLGDMLKKREATETANYNQGTQNNTEEFRNIVAGAKTSDEFAALQASGQLGEMRKRFGAQLDLSAMRTLEDGQLGVLQGREAANFAAQNAATTRLELPKVRGVNDLISNGLFDQARVAINEGGFADPSVLNNALKTAMVASDQAKLTKYKLDAETLAAQDAAAAKVLNEDVSASILGHQQSGRDMLAINTGLRAAASGLNLPTTSDGLPDRSKLNPVQVKLLARRGVIDGLDYSVNPVVNDTNAAEKLKSELFKSGKYTAAQLASVDGQITAGIDTTNQQFQKGKEGYKEQVAKAENLIAAREEGKFNAYAVGSPEVTKDFKVLRDGVKDLIATGTGINGPEDVEGIQTWVDEVARSGVKVNGQRLVPSVQNMEEAIRRARGGWFEDNYRRDDARMELMKILKDPTNKSSVARGEEARMILRNEAVIEEMRKNGLQTK